MEYALPHIRPPLTEAEALTAQWQAAETSQLFIPISTTQERFSVEIDPSQVEWANGAYTQVVVSIYTRDKKGVMTDIDTALPR